MNGSGKRGPGDDNDRAHDLRKEGDGPYRRGAGKCTCPNCEGTGKLVTLYQGTVTQQDGTCRTCHGSGEVIDE